MPSATELHNQICRKFKKEKYSQRFLSESTETGCSKVQEVRLEDIVSNNNYLLGYCDVVIDYEDNNGKKQKALIEVKSSADVINKDTNAVLRQIKKYQFHNKSITKSFLVYSGDASRQTIEDATIFTDEKITVLDINNFDEKKIKLPRTANSSLTAEDRSLSVKNEHLIDSKEKERIAFLKESQEKKIRELKARRLAGEEIERVRSTLTPKERKKFEKERLEKENQERLYEEVVQEDQKKGIFSETNKNCPKCQKPMVKDALNQYWICTRCGQRIRGDKQSLSENENAHLVQEKKERKESIDKGKRTEQEEFRNNLTKKILAQRIKSQKKQLQVTQRIKSQKKQLQVRKDLIQSVLGLICLIPILYYVVLPIFQGIVAIFFGGDYIGAIIFLIIIIVGLIFVGITLTWVNKVLR